MSCKTECMHKHACCVHLCRRAGCGQAGLGAGMVSLALNMRARGMACCMRIKNGMKNAACMPNSRHGDYQRSPPHFLRIAKIGGSQKARHRAAGHAMNHVIERKCMKMHADMYTAAAWHVPVHVACATGAQGFLCASCRSTRFFRRNSRRIVHNCT